MGQCDILCHYHISVHIPGKSNNLDASRSTFQSSNARIVRTSTEALAPSNTRCVSQLRRSRDLVRCWQRSDGFLNSDPAAARSLAATDAAQEEASMCFGVRHRAFCVYRKHCALGVQLSCDQQNSSKGLPVERQSTRTVGVSCNVPFQLLYFIPDIMADLQKSQSGSSSDASRPFTNISGIFPKTERVSTSSESPTAVAAIPAGLHTGADCSHDPRHQARAESTHENSPEAPSPVAPVHPRRHTSKR